MKKFLLMLLLPLAALAWEPTKPITVVVPNAPGAGNEIAFRVLAKHVESRAKVNFVYEYKPGAFDTVAMNYFDTLPGDGYHVAIPSCQSTYVTAEIWFAKNTKFNAMDFLPVTNMGKSPLAFYARLNTDVDTPEKLISEIKSGKRPINFAVGGAAHRLAIEYLIDKIGADRNNITIVEYKGPLPAVTDVAGGHAEFGVMPIAVSNTLMPTGKIKLLALAGEQTVPAYPTATLAHKYVPGLNVYGCWNIVLPKGTDPQIQKWYVDNFLPALRSQEYKTWMDENQVFLPRELGPVALKKDMEQLRAQWGPYVRKMPGPGGK